MCTTLTAPIIHLWPDPALAVVLSTKISVLFPRWQHTIMIICGNEIQHAVAYKTIVCSFNLFKSERRLVSHYSSAKMFLFF